MKSILLSIKPQWVAKILNGEKTIEVRKKFPKDYVGWVYLYCSKNGGTLCPSYKPDNAMRYVVIKDKYDDVITNGHIVARFWCDKVEEIVYQNAFNEPTYNTELLSERDLCIKSCLGLFGLFDYLGNKNGFAIHISKLEIFDRPKELKHFHYRKLFHRSEQDEDGRKTFKALIQLNKAPQNLCYVENID